MKVQVVVKNSSQKSAVNTPIAVTVSPADTALTFQERVAEVTNTLCFPDQQLLFKGEVLPDNQRLCSGNIKDGDVLEFIFQASEQTLAKQLSDLIGTKTVSLEELSLLYAHRHFVPLDDALKALGCDKGKLEAFLNIQKCFSVSGGQVKVVIAEKTTQAKAGLCPIEEDKVHGPIEVKISVEVHVPDKEAKTMDRLDDEDDLDLLRLDSSWTVERAKEIVSAHEQIPFPDADLVLQGRKLEDKLSLAEAGVANGCDLLLLVRASESSLASQLEALIWERAGLSPKELSLLYSHRFGTPVAQALQILGLSGNIRRFLQNRRQFSLNGGCVTLVNGPKLITPPSWQDENEPPLNEVLAYEQ